MITKIGKCGIGFIGAEHEEIFEFDDNTSEEEMNNAVWELAEQFLEAWLEDEE